MITISNNGQDIADTNYWETEHAAAGLCYLSANAGVWRLLVPEAAEGMLTDMRTGLRANIAESVHAPGRCWDIIFDDDTVTPFSLAIDKRQVDRTLRPGPCRLTVWTQRGCALNLACQVWV